MDVVPLVPEEQLEGIIRRASAAAAALEGTGDEEDQHELETFSQLRIARSLLQAHRRCFRTPSQSSRMCFLLICCESNGQCFERFAHVLRVC